MGVKLEREEMIPQRLLSNKFKSLSPLPSTTNMSSNKMTLSVNYLFLITLNSSREKERKINAIHNGSIDFAQFLKAMIFFSCIR